MTKRFLSFLLKEFFFWLTPPLIFLYYYVHHFHYPSTAIWAHLYGIGLIATSCLLLRVSFQRWLGFVWGDRLAILIYSAVAYILFVYYFLVIIGLQSWGNVITAELILSYAQQAPQLAEVIGIPFALPIVVLLIIFLIFVLLVAKLIFPSFDFFRRAIPISSTLLNLFLVSFIVLLGFYDLNFYREFDIQSKEPFKLTQWLGKGIHIDNAMYSVSRDARLEGEETQEKNRYVASQGAKKRNVILIVVDALRPDHLGIYGYGRQTTPYLQKLLNRGELVKFNQVHASCSASACGLASLASSRFSHQIPSYPFSLQQVLIQHGYRVNMILGGDHTNFYNLKEYYGKVNHFFDGSMAKGYYMNDDRLVLDNLKRLSKFDGHPTMFQFHMMSAHTLGKRHLEFEVFQPARRYAGKTSGDPVEAFTNHYDNGVLQLDAMINEILDTLRDKAYLNDALVVITADHGESLGEHKKFSHANSVRGELIHIPLILIQFPDSASITKSENQFVAQIDIAPTVLRSLEMPIPSVWQGIPIQEHSRHTGAYRDFSYFQFGSDVGVFDHRRQGSLVKYWLNFDIQEEFAFDVMKDPKEQTNLIWSFPVTYRDELRKQVRKSKIKLN